PATGSSGSTEVVVSIVPTSTGGTATATGVRVICPDRAGYSADLSTDDIIACAALNGVPRDFDGTDFSEVIPLVCVSDYTYIPPAAPEIVRFQLTSDLTLGATANA